MDRDRRTRLAQKTLEILEAGEYTTYDGQVVRIAEAQAEAVRDTKLYRPADFPDGLPLAPPPNAQDSTWEVTPETTLEAAYRVVTQGLDADPLCLNFASARNPGGGFLGGAQAQEESLARSSGLYPCQISNQEMYDYNRRESSCLYSDHMIYSPRIPVFRDDTGKLLDAPYTLSFITAPAVNAGVVRQREPQNVARIVPTLRERMRKVLWVAKSHGHRTLILGAWGCGVFQNDPEVVANLFAELLCPGGEFSRHFEHTIYAVYDRSKDGAVYQAFEKRLA